MPSISILDRLGEEININDRVRFRAWQGRDNFFSGTGDVQNIDPFGNIYVEPDSALEIEGSSGSFDATVLMVSTSALNPKVVESGGHQTFRAYKEHFGKMDVDSETKPLIGVSWVERVEGPKMGKW